VVLQFQPLCHLLELLPPLDLAAVFAAVSKNQLLFDLFFSSLTILVGLFSDPLFS
jgi:hypothetical protein